MPVNDVRRLRGPAGVLIAVVLAGVACTGPARSTAAYQNKAAETADEAVSASRTVLLAARSGADDRSFAATIAVAIEDAEADAQTARDAFASIQPPDAGSDQVRATVLPPVQRACDVIADVRIAARRGQMRALPQIAAPLQQIADQLDALSARYG